MKLESYISGRWQSGQGEGRVLVNPVTGETIAYSDASGIDIEAGFAFARAKGQRALGDMSFAERGALLKAAADVLQSNRDAYMALARENSGNTEADASVDIDGGIGTLKYYARLGATLGEHKCIAEAGRDQLAREPVFFAQHFWRTRPGIALQINAFNFPSWGMWEKVAQAMLAGVASFAKPASSTALLSERMVRDVITAGVLPEGALSLLVGSANGIMEKLGPMDSVAFTGSASTAQILRKEAAAMPLPPRLTIEADSVNATIIGPDVTLNSALFDLALREATKALSVKAGQLCTNIRRILVHQDLAKNFGEALAGKIAALAVGDPADEATRVGPLINADQRDEAHVNMAKLSKEARVLAKASLPDVAPKSGFVAPTLLVCDKPLEARQVHEIEVFGPCATIMPYGALADATKIGAAGEGSLALSLFSNDRSVQTEITGTLGAWHGRILCVDEEVGKSHTGQAIVMPQCVHGGPGRAGGGEELGGIRGLRFHMQRSAIQGGPEFLDELTKQSSEALM